MEPGGVGAQGSNQREAWASQAHVSPWSRDRCGLYQNLDVSWTNLTLLWLSGMDGSGSGRAWI